VSWAIILDKAWIATGIQAKEMRMKLLLRIIINMVTLAATTYLLGSRMELSGGWVGLLAVALIFGLVNAFIRPIVKLFSLPITCLTLGLFTLVINAGMLLLTAFLAGSLLTITGSAWDKIVTSFIAAIVISIISGVLSWFLPDDNK
jgi:putative membrane protein